MEKTLAYCSEVLIECLKTFKDTNKKSFMITKSRLVIVVKKHTSLLQ
jgi:hypothetical protein